MKRKYTQEEVERLMTFNFYVNPDDRNVFVRKKGRCTAWTMNLGNPWSWALIAAFILAVMGLNMIVQYAA